MYAVYSYKSTATTAQVLRDIIMLLTGTTNLNSLSASCDVATSSVDNTFTTGNNFDHDSSISAALTQSLRMSVWDNTSVYFYVQFVVTTTSLGIGIHDSWNAGTHVVVAPGAQHTSLMNINTIGTTAGVLYIWSDGKSLMVTSGTSAYALSVTQFTRDDLWRTNAGGYKPVACNGSIVNNAPGGAWASTTGFTLKSLNSSGVAVNAGTAGSNVNAWLVDSPPSAPTGYLSSTLTSIAFLQPLRGGTGAGHGWGGSITEISPIYYLNSGSIPAYTDEVVFGAEKYKVMGSGTKYCVRIQ